MLGRVQGSSGPLSPSEVPQGWEELCRGCVTQHIPWQLQPPPLGWKGSQNPRVTTTPLSTLSSSLPPPLLVFTPRPLPPFNNFIAVAKLPLSLPPSFCDHAETKRSKALKTAPRNGQLMSHRDVVSTHYSGHQEYLLPGNHPAVGFSRGLSRTHEKQQSVQRWTPGSSGPPASPQRVSSGLPLISIWLHSETHPLMRPLLSHEREGRR